MTKALEQLENGQALKQFKDFIEAQGGDAHFIEDYSLLGQASYQIPYRAKKSGQLSHWEEDLVV